MHFSDQCARLRRQVRACEGLNTELPCGTALSPWRPPQAFRSSSPPSILLHQPAVLAQAAVTKYHGLGGINSRQLFSHSSRSSKSRMEAQADSVSGERSFAWRAGFSRGLSSVPVVAVEEGGDVRELPAVPSHTDTDPFDQGPTLLSSFVLNYFRGPNRATVGVRASTHECEGGHKCLVSAATK